MDGFHPGAVNRVKECICTPGGKGLNVARAVTIAGAEAVATGFVGGNSGKFIEESMKNYQVQTAFYHLRQESRSCINIWDEKSRKQTELLEPGPEVGQEDYKQFERQYKELVEQADVVTLSGSAPRGLDETVYQGLIHIAKKAGKKVILDTSRKLLERGMQAGPTMVKPNMDEIRMLSGKDCSRISELVEEAEKIRRYGAEMVAVSLGKDGCILVSDSGNYRAFVPEIQAKNTVGCGDSMIAGFALGLSEGLPIPEILRKASAISAAAAMNEETGCFRKVDMEKLFAQIVIKPLS